MTISFSRSLIFEVKSTGSKLAFIRILRLGLGNARAVSVFGCLRKTSDVFGRLRTSSGIFRNDRVDSQDKNLTSLSQKKLAGIEPGLMWGNMGTLWELCNKFLPLWWGKCGDLDF